MDPRRGPEYIIRTVLGHVRESYQDLRPVVADAALVISHPLTYAVPILAEEFGIPWLSTVLSPISFLSAHDPSVLPNAPELMRLNWLGPSFLGPILALGRRMTLPWTKPVLALRRDLGLPPPSGNAILEAHFSPRGVLALFSPLIAPPQPDWPANATALGFPFVTETAPVQPPQHDIERFLAAGEPPIVFTLGSAAVAQAGSFWMESITAVQALRQRAILLVGRGHRGELASRLPEGIIAVEYAPHSTLFPSAAVVTHQCGIGTLGEALRAGRPQLIMPFGQDQPDNAQRAARLGVARVVPRSRYTAKRVAEELARLLSDTAHATRAAQIGEIIRAEQGAARACDVIAEHVPPI